MKKQIFQFLMVILLVLGGGGMAVANANNNKPQRPEKLEEIKSQQPSEYHTWVDGRWKWARKQEAWNWQSGYWKFDHELYAFKNRFRYNGYYRSYTWRYIAVPIGRGYYRIVRY